MTARPLLVFLVAVLPAVGCSVSEDLPAEEVCRDAGYSVANRLFECTGDADRANSGYDTLLDLGCRVSGFAKDELGASSLSLEGGGLVPVPEAYGCPADLRALTCDVIKSGESDASVWLAAAPRCAALFGSTPQVGAGGAP